MRAPNRRPEPGSTSPELIAVLVLLVLVVLAVGAVWAAAALTGLFGGDPVPGNPVTHLVELASGRARWRAGATAVLAGVAVTVATAVGAMGGAPGAARADPGR
jgi:hypothetical protein